MCMFSSLYSCLEDIITMLLHIFSFFCQLNMGGMVAFSMTVFHVITVLTHVNALIDWENRRMSLFSELICQFFPVECRPGNIFFYFTLPTRVYYTECSTHLMPAFFVLIFCNMKDIFPLHSFIFHVFFLFCKGKKKNY